MTTEQFKRIYNYSKVGFWFAGCATIGGVISNNKLAMLLGVFMLVTMLIVYVIVKFKKSSKEVKE